MLLPESPLSQLLLYNFSSSTIQKGRKVGGKTNENLKFFEDALLIMLGRYTEINILILFIATIAFGFVVAAVAKHPKVHKVFHD